MIQDIAPHIFSNAYAPKRPEATSYALYFNGHTVLAGKDSSTLRFPRFSELNGIEESVYEKAIYLFAIDNDCFYLVHQVPEEQPEFELKDIGLFRTSGPRHLAFAGITGYSLYNGTITISFVVTAGQNSFIMKRNGCYIAKLVITRNTRKSCPP